MTDVPKSFFTPHDLSDQVAITVERDLTAGIPVFEEVFRNQGFISNRRRDGKSGRPLIGEVIRGENTRTAHKAAIRVVVLDKDQEWHATRVKDDTYNFHIDCMHKLTAKKEEIDKFINVFGSIVQSYLNRFSNLQPVIAETDPPIRAYNAWAPKMVKGYAQQGAYRVARISYWIKILNPYVHRANLVC